MYCPNCGHPSVPGAPFCGVCGKTAAMPKRAPLTIGAAAAVVFLLLAAVVMQGCMLSCWITVQLPLSKTAAFSPFGMSDFASRIIAAVGGVDVLDTLAFQVNAVVWAMQIIVATVIVCAVGWLFSRQSMFPLIAVISAIAAVLLSAGMTWVLSDSLHVIKNAAVLDAVDISAAPVVMIGSSSASVISALWLRYCHTRMKT